MRQTKTNLMVSMVFILLALVSIHANAASSQPAKAPFRAVVDPDNISPVVLVEGSLPVTWTNDDTYPWLVGDNYVYNGSNYGHKNTEAWISFSYESNAQTEVSFYWCNQYSSYHSLEVYIDGVLKGSTTSSSYTKERFYLPRGQHVVSFRDVIGENVYTSNNYKQYSYVKEVNIREVPTDLESIILAEGSKPLTFTNDPVWPWMPQGDGRRIFNSNYGVVNTKSTLTTTFTIERPSIFSYKREITTYNNSSSNVSHYLYTTIKNLNGGYWCWYNNYTTADNLFLRVLEPGTYTVELADSVVASGNYRSYISDVMVNDNWIDIEMTQSGTLGVLVLYIVESVKDIELLKVKGTLNSYDWEKIGDMTNLRAIDLSEARFDNVPSEAFSKNTKLQYVSLPEGVKTIGSSAFVNTNLQYIKIPASVTTIESSAFKNVSWLVAVDFAEGSQLSIINSEAFYGSDLRQFTMPNTVTSIGNNVFNNCKNLKSLSLSDALTYVPNNTCYYCSNLSYVHLPNNLESLGNQAFYYNSKLKKINFPESLSFIGEQAFYYCDLDSVKLPLRLSSLGRYSFASNSNLKYIELPSSIDGYNENFSSCKAIEKIVCRSATPPSITNDPFNYGRAKSEITLVVPSFAVVTYKLDSYWNKFGSIIEGEGVDYWRVSGPLMLLNNIRMDGKPDIDLYYGGQLSVGGNAPMPVGQLNYYAGKDGYGRLLNTCPNMTIDNLTTYYSTVGDNGSTNGNSAWHFISPIYDVDLTKIQHSDPSASFVFRYYNSANRAEHGPGSSWQNVFNGKLEAGKGYIYRSNKSGILTFDADESGIEKFVNVNDVTIYLETHNSQYSSDESWNYIGNPYPCYYDIYYLDFTAPITVWNGSSYLARSITDDKLALAPMQAFFVQKPDAVDKIVFHKEGRQVESTPNHASMAPRYAPNQNKDRKLYDFTISTDTIVDETRVVINDKASLAYEIERDAAKFLSMDNDVPQMYTIDNDQTKLAINERPMSDSIVNLGVYIGKPGTYTIDASRSPGEVQLIDQVSKISTNLNEESYTFDIEQVGFINNRFILKFKNGSSNIIETRANNTINIQPVNGGVDIESSVSTWANIYTVDGRLVSNVKCQSGCTHVNLPNGIYLVQVGNTANKIIVQ